MLYNAAEADIETRFLMPRPSTHHHQTAISHMAAIHRARHHILRARVFVVTKTMAYEKYTGKQYHTPWPKSRFYRAAREIKTNTSLIIAGIALQQLSIGHGINQPRSSACHWRLRGALRRPRGYGASGRLKYFHGMTHYHDRNVHGKSIASS